MLASRLNQGRALYMMEKRCRRHRGSRLAQALERRMNKQAIALLSLGHFLIDSCQGVVPALVPFPKRLHRRPSGATTVPNLSSPRCP
jgi:hypothetical protein